MFHGKINQPLGFLGRVDRTGRVVGRVEDDGFGVLQTWASSASKSGW